MTITIDLTGVATDLTTFAAALEQMHNYLTNLSQGDVPSETCLATLHELRLNINELQETISSELHTQQVAQEFTDKAIQDHMAALSTLLDVPKDSEIQVNIIDKAA